MVYTGGIFEEAIEDNTIYKSNEYNSFLECDTAAEEYIDNANK